MDSGVVRTEAQAWGGGAESEGSMRHGRREVQAPRRVAAAARRNKGNTAPCGRGGGLTTSPVWPLFPKPGATDTVSLFSFSLPASERSQAISPPLLPNSFLPPYKRRDLNSGFNSPFTSFLKTQSWPESWAPGFPFFRKEGPDYTNHEIEGHRETNAPNHYSIFSFQHSQEVRRPGNGSTLNNLSYPTV